MMLTPPAHSRPSLLPIRLILGGALMSSIVLLAHGGSVGDVIRLLLGLPATAAQTAAAPLPLTWAAALRTTLSITLSGLVGLSFAYLTTACLSRFGRTGSRLGATLGRLLATTTVVALVWAWMGWWIGSAGGTVETLMPPRPLWEDGLATALSRLAWQETAPMVGLALVASGLLLHTFCSTLSNVHFEDFIQGLKGRGIPAGRMRSRHLLPLLWPLFHRRLQGIGTVLLALSVPLEFALQSHGWGAAFGSALQAQAPAAIAASLYASGWMLAAWIGFCRFLRPKDRRPLPLLDDNRPSPSLLDAQRTAALDTPHLRRDRAVRLSGVVFNVLVATLTTVALYQWVQSAAAHHPDGLPQALTADLLTLSRIGLGVLAGGAAMTALRHTILGDHLRRFGLLETLAWSPLLVWALAWGHGPGSVVSSTLALTIAGALILAVELHACTRRAVRRDYLTAAKVLGASPWRAWCTHALGSWLKDLAGTLCWLIAGLWSGLILCDSMIPAAQADPAASLGQWIAAASSNALIDPQPLIAAAGIALLSTLLLWTLSRIILPSDDF